MELAMAEGGYAGTIGGTTDDIPEMVLQDIMFDGERLTFEVDLPTEGGSERISVDLQHADGTLEGMYTDPSGDSDRLRLRREG
jgi:hypothetical protein